MWMTGVKKVGEDYLGFIIAAISPAIVVPQMIELRDKGFGKRRDIPTLILAGASLDDVVAITVFGIFSGIALGESGLAARLLDIPVAIGLGLVLGLLAGALIIRVSRSFGILPARVAILVMIAGILMVEFEKLHLIPMAGLLGVMAMGFIILERDKPLSRELAVIFAGLWVAAEIILFVSIGAAIDLTAGELTSGAQGQLELLYLLLSLFP